MQSPTALLSDTVAEIFATASSTRMLKYSHYERLTSALNCALDRHDLRAIQRLLRFVKQGRIQLVSDFPQSLLAL